MSHPSPRTRIKEIDVMIADVVVETSDSVTLVLFTGNDRPTIERGTF